MNAEQVANQPVKLIIEGVDANGDAKQITFVLAKSLPLAIEVALNRDLVELGKFEMTPHERMRPQLESLWRKSKQAADAKDFDAAEQFTASWNRLHDRMCDNLISGRADDLASEVYWAIGRKSVAGLCKEIVLRSKHAGVDVSLAELQAIITAGNANVIFAQLQEVLGEIGNFTEKS